MNDDMYGELVLALIEKKNIKQIIRDFRSYIVNYEKGIRPKFCVDMENAIEKQNL